MCPASSSRSGHGNQARRSGHVPRRRGAPSYNQTASRNSRTERDYQNLNTLPPAMPSTPTIVQYNVHTHLTVEGIDHLLQLQSSMGYVVDGVFVATSSIVTPTVSTGSYMEYGSSLGTYTPASEPPEPWPYHSGSHHLVNVGAQFAADCTPLAAADDGSGDCTMVQDERSPYPTVIVVADDGRAGVFDPAGVSDLKGGDANFDRADLLPSDPSKAYLESLSDESWLRPIPLRIRRASTFPLLGQYNEDANKDPA